MSVCCKLVQNSYNVCLHKSPVIKPSLVVVPVRWRKPRWVPRGKSKEFVVSERPEINPEEHEFMKTQTNIYNTKMKSIRKFLVQNIPVKKLNTEVKMTRHERFENAWKKMHEANDTWNIEVAETREKEQRKEAAEKQRKYEEMLEKDKEQIFGFLQAAEERLQYEKDAYESHIVPENVDAEIEKVLDSKVDYEYALNRRGHRIMEKPLPATKESSTVDNVSDT